MQRRMNALAHPNSKQRSGKRVLDSEKRMTQFILKVWECHDHGFGFMAARKASTKQWIECEFPITAGEAPIGHFFDLYSRREFDLYFCPNAFRINQRKQEFALPTCFGWCDIDSADPRKFKPRPSVLVESSPQRFQGLWIWNKILGPDEAQAFSRALTYHHDGDKNGWTITKYLRIPYSYNHKPQYSRPLVKLVDEDWSPLSARPKAMKVIRPAAKHYNAVEIDFAQLKTAKQIVRKYFKKLPGRIRELLLARKPANADRSAQIYAMVASLHEAGASEHEIASCLWCNPYFLSKHGQDEQKLETEMARILAKLD